MQLIHLLEWWNIIFVLPFIAAMGYLIIMATTGIGASDGDVDVHVNADIDADVDFESDFDHDVEGQVEHDHEVHTDTNHSFLFKMLSFFGVGKVPFNIIMFSFIFIWSSVGFMSNYLMWDKGINPAYFWWISVIIGLVLAIFLVKLIGKVVAKIFPTYENYGCGPRDFIGSVATVRFTIKQDFGSVMLYDKNDNMQELQARVRIKDEHIPVDTTVLIVRYNRERKVYLVTPYSG